MSAVGDRPDHETVLKAEADRPNCGVLSNGYQGQDGVTELKANQFPNIPSTELDQKKLLCGSKRLFN